MIIYRVLFLFEAKKSSVVFIHVVIVVVHHGSKLVVRHAFVAVTANVFDNFVNILFAKILHLAQLFERMDKSAGCDFSFLLNYRIVE